MHTSSVNKLSNERVFGHQQLEGAAIYIALDKRLVRLPTDSEQPRTQHLHNMTSLLVAVMDAKRLAVVVLATALVVQGSSKHYTADAENRHVFLDWEVSYAVRSPLGVARRVITIDGRLPGPLLNLTTNDVAHVNVINTLDEPFLLTWCFCHPALQCKFMLINLPPAGTDR